MGEKVRHDSIGASIDIETESIDVFATYLQIDFHHAPLHLLLLICMQTKWATMSGIKYTKYKPLHRLQPLVIIDIYQTTTEVRYICIYCCI